MDRFVWITFLATGVFGALDWLTPVYANGASLSGRLHVAFAMAWLLGLIVHVALHNKWITLACRTVGKPVEANQVTAMGNKSLHL